MAASATRGRGLSSTGLAAFSGAAFNPTATATTMPAAAIIAHVALHQEILLPGTWWLAHARGQAGLPRRMLAQATLMLMGIDMSVIV